MLITRLPVNLIRDIKKEVSLLDESEIIFLTQLFHAFTLPFVIPYTQI